MISVRNVSKVFGDTTAVKNISFDVRKGEHCVLLGTSGCGKTTTLRLINRLIDTTQGTIQVNDQDIKAQAPEKLRRNIGYVLQRNSLFPHYTVFENIAVVPKLLGWDKQLIAERILQLTQKVQYLSKPPQKRLKLCDNSEITPKIPTKHKSSINSNYRIK